MFMVILLISTTEWISRNTMIQLNTNSAEYDDKYLRLDSD